MDKLLEQAWEDTPRVCLLLIQSAAFGAFVAWGTYWLLELSKEEKATKSSQKRANI